MPILVTDFDGTLTRRDFFDLILERYDPPGGREIWQRFRRGEATHFEAISGIFALLRTDLAEADALIDALDPPPGVTDAVHRLQEAGWEIVVASAGCRWYIERLLARLQIALTVHASPGEFAPETGLVMRPPRDSRFYHLTTGIDKPAVVRDALARSGTVACAGDSGTDREGALLVPPVLRFATGWLARDFAKNAIPHIAFGAWPEIADYLLAAERSPAPGSSW